MTTTLEIINVTDFGAHRCRHVMARDGEKWVEFSVWDDHPTLTSFRGNNWPDEFPDVFDHFGDPGAINHRSFYRLKAPAMAGLLQDAARAALAKTEA